MNYEQKYNEALARARDMMSYKEVRREDMEYIFPELKESEDERIRKEIIKYIKLRKITPNHPIADEWIAWLEKQGQSKKTSIWKHWKDGIAGNGDGKPAFLIKNGLTYSLSSCLGFECDYIELSELDSLMLGKQREQKTADEPRLKVEEGKWYVCISQFCNCIEGRVYKATSDNRIIDDFGTEYDMHNDAYKYFRLWDIKDAKDGDVLATKDNRICIFDNTVEEEKYPFAYCGLSIYGFEVYDRTLPFTHLDVYPATKEQRDKLEEEMLKAGYKWDADKKELIKL